MVPEAKTNCIRVFYYVCPNSRKVKIATPTLRSQKENKHTSNEQRRLLRSAQIEKRRLC